jgi:MFS transporter, NNP family, nitrate/nitrite transporter
VEGEFMVGKDFLNAGHWPTLLAAFVYFDVSFMVWIILGPLGVQIASDLALDPAQKGFMVALPVLAGAFLRVVNGLAVDRLGARRTGLIAQIVVILGLSAFWAFGGRTHSQTLALGVVLGVAGASFAVALPLASRWYPPRHQGVALGVAGAGNSGTVLAALFAPSLAAAFGWVNVIGLAVVPLAGALLLFWFCAKEGPQKIPAKSLAEYAKVLRERDAWLLMFYYAVTFGGFSGLASSLGIYFNTQYRLDAVAAGYGVAACVFAGSLVRPIGGAVADRIGGVKVLTVLYGAAAAALFVVSLGSPSLVVQLVALIVAMLSLGMGNGAVFQLAPQRFRAEIGVVTGLVGMAGGVGGFYLASSLGLSKQFTGSYQTGFLIFAALALGALFTLLRVERRWRTDWVRLDVAPAQI